MWASSGRRGQKACTGSSGLQELRSQDWMYESSTPSLLIILLQYCHCVCVFFSHYVWNICTLPETSIDSPYLYVFPPPSFWVEFVLHIVLSHLFLKFCVPLTGLMLLSPGKLLFSVRRNHFL